MEILVSLLQHWLETSYNIMRWCTWAIGEPICEPGATAVLLMAQISRPAWKITVGENGQHSPAFLTVCVAGKVQQSRMKFVQVNICKVVTHWHLTPQAVPQNKNLLSLPGYNFNWDTVHVFVRSYRQLHCFQTSCFCEVLLRPWSFQQGRMIFSFQGQYGCSCTYCLPTVLGIQDYSDAADFYLHASYAYVLQRWEK